jgi:hypothetical protein
MTLDRTETVDPGSLQQFGNHILARVRYLADQPTLEMDSQGTKSPSERLYFPLIGNLVHYPIGWTWLLAATAGLCFLGTVAYSFHQKDLTWNGLG